MSYRTAFGLFPPTPSYTFKDIPDLSGKVAIVTGANTGIGKVTARELLAHGAKVYVACRSEEKAAVAIEDLKKVTGKNDVHYLQLDLASISAAKAAARRFQEHESKLDILVNNAGLMEPPAGSKSEDGYELQWGTNVLGPHAFTRALTPQLIEASKGKPPGSVRIIWVSSSAHWAYFSKKQRFDYDIFQGDVKRNTQKEYYGWSKLANIQQAHAFTKELSEHGVFSAALHPGIIKSDLYRHYNFISRNVMSLMMINVDQGALTQTYLATAPDLTLADAKDYYVPLGQKCPTMHPQAEDAKSIAETWAHCEAEIAKYQ